ncbi:MARTX multifunctional-autoprocessing repeats-in-toxin holotoxin RtxA, partial [Vibrio cholerae]|uniref:MARTX multifunctional-autoprocessing repeats-in-toxin holotoxin RtxA n=1 Tax=Vibrio cholerae TaxID=666 RepID=UPI0011DAB247
MGKPFWRSVEYFFTGNYSADDGNNNIVAIGFGGQIHAYGGDDHVTVGSIGATVYTGSGNDTVVGGSAYLKVEDSTGHLTVKGAAGYADINKSGDGNVSFAGAAGGVSIDHLGNHGDVNYGGAAAYNGINRKGLSGNVTFAGAGGYNALWHETNQGNLSFTGAGAGNKLDRTWFNRYQGSHGDVTFDGAGAANSISSRVETGNITFRGAGADNHLVRKGKVGDITLQGAGASNRIERTHQAEDVYTQTRGNIRFEGVGGYNSLYSDVAHGDIHFSGGGAYNTIIRKGSGNDFAKEGMTNAKADEIVLTKAVMSGSWIGQDHHVTAVKSASEPNTYLFAFADSTYTKINKVQLRNDPQTGELKYYSTAWYKEGNHLSNLANQDISDNGGFTAVNINGAYTLSDLKVEHQQSVTVHAVEKSLTEYEWVTYANGAVIDAKEVSLSDAKMGGHAIYADGTKVDVKAVKSNRQPNTYIYAKVLGPYTKIVVVELANDPETGALKYQARSWYKEGDHTANIANQDISSATGYNPMGKGGYSLSDLHYSVNAVRSTSETVADIEEYTDQTLFKPANDSGESSGDVRFNGAGGGNVIKSNVTRGNVHFNGGGIANVILHSSQFGNTEFNGGGAANVIVKSGEEGDLTFRGAGLANVLVHQSQQGKMDVYAGGAVNVLVRLGDGQYLAHLLAYGNISVQKGSGDSRVVMLGGYNTHTQIGSGNGLWLAAGGFNVMTQVGQGDVAAVLAGGANVLTKMGEGELTSGMLGGANVITHISNDDQLSNTTAVALGGANILTKKGKGNTLAVMGGGANVLTHVGDGTTTGVMVGGANILTKVGNGDTTGILLGVGNVLTHVGDGQTLGVMGAAGNIFTKVGDGTSIAVMIGAGNIFTHVGEGNAWALMGGLGNVFTKVGNGDALALMVAEANVFTHIGDGMSVALMLAKGNVATKVGNGTTLAAMVGNANIFTHVGSGSTFAAMIGQANIMTKVGNDLTAALMVGKANIMTHVGDGTSLGLFAGEVNVMTKVGNGTTLAAMFGKANIMTHVGDGLTGVLALGEANIVTKVGDDFMGVVAAAKANVVTHVGDATTAAVLAGKGNILTKVGEGTTVGLLISDVGNVMTHVGDGTTIGIAKGKANLITKVGDGLGVNVAWGQANVFTQVGDGDRYNFAKGEANLITKVGDGQEVSVVQGEANIITHVGNGDDYTGAWGKANVITKVGHGQNVVLAKGEANIVTQVGDGDSFNALWSKGNIVTKVGDGMQVTAAKGQANITTTVGNGLNVTAAYGDANINTKVGDGVSVNVAWGKYNINTKVGDGLNVAVMKGKANANIHVGDGLNINASYAQNNVAIKVGNGDFYSLAVASSNTSSNKLSALFDNIKQTVLGVGGSQAINYLVQGDEASSSGTHKGRGAIATPEITKLDGFQMDAIKEVGSDLGDSLTGSVTKVDTPDLNKMQHALNVDDSSVQAPNLIVNGDFELGEHGWQSTHGVEASYAGSVYGVEGEGHGARVTELDTYTNTSLYQDLANLAQGEVIAVSFDFAKRAGLSNNEGIEVLWNGEVVFSSSGDESTWQQKTLKLTAQAGSNRIEFKGTGHNDGLGYILDNVVATSESSQQANAIREHATQNPAAQNALSDKERAEADRQRLEQEKQKQLDAVAGSQSQLESTDQQALENNGQAQRDAVQEESEAITAELTKLAQGLDVLDGQATHTGESGDQWRNEFASGLLAGVQTQLDDAKQLANGKIAEAKQTHADNQNKVKDAVAKSEAGVAKGEQNRAGAEQDIADAQADAEKRKADALAKGKDAQQAESDAHHAVNNAQSRGDRDVQLAENKANQVQADAQGAKQNEGDRPDRQGVTGSGLSGNAHSVEGAGETDSHVKTDSQTNADGRFSEGLTEQEQEALEGATNAVNRLQINAGIRAKNSGSTITTMFTEANTDSIVVPTTKPQDVVRKEIRISGVNLEGLGEASHDSAVSLVAARAEKVANLYRWLDSDHPRATEQYIPVPGFERVDVNVSDETKQRLTQFVSGYIEHTDNQVPKDQAQALATLFVEATLNYDWDKRVEFLTKLESYGYSFEAPHGENSLVSFWSGRNFKEYRNVLDNAQPDGKKVVYDIDVQGNAFAIKLNKQLMRWGDMFLDLENADQNHLQSSIEAAAYSNTGFWSSVYATGAKDDVYVIAEGGMRLGNYFWNVELPLLRQLQREGLVGEIRLLDKPVSEYKDVPVNEIGHKLTDAGVGVKVRFDALSAAQQAELLAINPKGYKADSLVELDVKLSAIDSMLRDALPFYSLRTERNLLVQEGDEGFKVRAWPGSDGKSKTIVLDNPEDATQQKTIERFILANFQNFEQMPDELFLVDNKVISHDKGITHILAQKVDGAWLYNAKVDLMSVTELLDAANVTGKIRGESYQQVIDALSEYHSSVTELSDYEQESIEKLLSLRKKIEGYVLGHPDSGRIAAMNSLLNQVNTRLEEVSVLAVSEPNIKAQDSFSRLYDQLETANLKGTKHLYLDQNGEFVTKGKGHLANIDLLGSREAVLEKVKLTVSNEYGQTVADTIFAGLSAKDLAKDGKGIDIAGLKKVHLAIEQHLSPVSATLFLWKPSDHSALGHAALQISQGRTQLEGQAAADFNQQNYVSWWPLGSKSSNISNILNVATKDQPDLKLRWKDFSQPAAHGESLAFDMQTEENDDFGLKSAEDKLKDFIKQLASASGVDKKFKDISQAFTMMALMNPDILESANIPEHISKPFVDQWNDTSYDMQDVAQRFAKELQEQAKVAVNSEQMEQQISEVVQRFAQDELDKIQTFKETQADQGRVFRINLEGLDVAAMQAEWHRLSNDPDARYQLLTKNCSSTVAKVLKAGGADKLIGHTWLPKFGVWTPTELFNFGQALQEAQLEIAAKKQSHQVTDVLDALSGNEKPKENVAIENDGTPPRDKESLSPLTRFLNNELYGDKEARRKIGEITQTLLDHAVEKGESQKITLQGEAGRLTGYYHQGTTPSEGETSSPSGKVVLFLHGSGSSAEEQASAIRNHYQKQGIDMLAVNLRGYGESDGGPSEKGLYQDARTMFNYLVNDKGIDPSNIIIHGYSMGGPIAADLARYAAQNGQAVSGLLLDRPMPSMTKAITAHEVANPAGIVGAIAKAVNGQFSVEKNLEGLPKETSILLLTDNEGLGNEGEKLRTKLTASGYNVTGEQTFYGHEASNRLMSQYADQIVSGLSSSASVDEDLDQQRLDTTSTKDQGISNKNDHLQVVDSKEALADGKILHNQDVNSWGPITVTPTTDGGETRFDGQIIVQMENDPVVAKAAANLAGKHAESSVVVQLDSDGNYRVVYGDPSKLDGKLRWQLVGHGRDHSESNNTRLSGYSADELAVKLAKFQQSFNQAENINNKPDHISIVGCSLVSDDKQKGFGHQFINAMDANGLRVDVSVRSSELAVDEAGRKHTKDANGDWVQKAENNKVSLSWDAQGEVVAKDEPIRNGIAEGDIDLSRIGVNNVDEPARGAIGDNSDVFDAPEKRKPETEVIANSSSSNQLSYSGNIQVNVGEGEFTAVNWGTSNVGIKVGTGGFKSLAFGDNNVMVHIGDGESKHSVDIGGYQALEGAQMFLGNRNVSFNFGHSNDLILMMDKSIPTPPLVNPFDGAARISGVLQGIAMSGEGEDWLAAQEQQWTLSGAKKFVKDMSGLDQSSSVDYTTLVELDSQNERDSRGLKHDAEATLNKQYNQWLSGNGNSGTSQLSRADKLRQANEKLAFNFAVGGQGADIQVTTGNWNFMFGDNIQSILDTNLGSLFGLMTQQFTATGQAKTTFTYTPQDLPRQLKNKLLGQLAGVGAETTLADIFGVDYTASGQIVSRNGQAVDGVAILKEMLEVIGEFSGDQLQAFVDPAKLLDSLKAGIDMGADGIKSFAETHGLKEKAPEEEKDNSSVSVNGANVNSAQGATVADGNTETAETQDRAFGFNSLNLPNLFATIFSQDKQKEMKSLVENLKQNLTADLLNMKEKTFDFLRNSGHLQGDGDINISLGNYNFNWGGDGKDLGAYLGDNNNFWGGRGDDVFYATGTSNIFTGGEGNDMGVLMGRENMMFGGDGNDTAVVAGRINHVFLGAGDDQSFVFGEGGEIDTGSGRDYVVTSGNFNRVDTGDDQDYSVTIGNNNQVELGAGNDFANVFGNYNRINAGAGNDVVKLMGYHAVLNGGDGDDHLIAAAIS